MIRSAAFVALAVLVAACGIVKETGRRQTTWFPDSYMSQMGADAFAEAVSGYPEITRGADYEMVQRVGQRLAAVCDETHAWEIKLLDAPDVVNAFALPGGKVAVYSGLLRVTQNEDALAAVVGHEIAHVTADHGNERMTQSMIEAGLSTAADLALESWGGMSADDRATVMSALGYASDVGFIKPFSRTHESEADEIGLRYLIRAGYDPNEAPKLWERMAALSPGRQSSLTDTHPDPAARAEALRALIPRFLAEERPR